LRADAPDRIIPAGYAEWATAKANGEDWPLLHKPYGRQELAVRIRSILDKTLG
jgi:hypothetical protein